MKPTKRAKKNQARKQLKLDSERITKEANQNIETPQELMHSLSDVVHYALTIIFAMILSSLLFFVVSKQFDDHFSKQLANRTAMHSETVSKNDVHTFVNSIVGIEPLIEPESRDTGDAIPKKHSVEGMRINNTTQPSNEDYQKVVASNMQYLEYFNSVNRARESLSNNANNDDKEIRRVRIVPAAGLETKDNIFVDIVNYERDKKPSKNEIAENIKKESAFLLASENTEEGKLKLAAAERENQKITNKEPDANPTPTFIREHGISLFILLYVMWGSLQYNDYRKDKKRRLVYEEDESQSEVSPTIIKINNHKDLNRYSNKL
ncbi:Unknown protein sequence [Pseudomonas amygdali pv. eriobotryae]|uniref:Uncharacterized protein n=1 Tax=Pseudomonas amygdali pv. eriobotryae TaxID=129137 RepID=A0A0P9QND5_PSEA0|nr:hypothetical protein [Pseudomonas amygdali]KPX26147.1 Unknown protein sequence [Pseudomonas amygdali pv. eriobotryae]